MPEERCFEETLKEAAGFINLRDRGPQFSMARITEANDLIYNSVYQGKVIAPHVREFLLREALTTSDFPLLFGDVLDRQMLAAYKATPPVWKSFCHLSTVPDFRDAYRFKMSGGDEALAAVSEKGEYLASNRSEIRYIINVIKYGRQFDISWESLINDDLDALKDTPLRFANAAMRTEHRIASGLYVHNDTLATGGRGNLTANLLTIANLETGLEWFGARTDVGGEAIAVKAKFLVVPPSLELTAMKILNSPMQVISDNAAGPAPYPTVNVTAQMGLKLIVDPYIDILDATTTGNSAWYLFADPNDLRVLECAHLRGHERPEIAMKSSDKVAVGGAPLSALSGDFATDNVFYRVRTIFGGVTLDWRGFYFGGHIS